MICLYNEDGIIHEESEREDESEKWEEVECQSKGFHEDESKEEYDGDRDGRNKRKFESEECEEYCEYKKYGNHKIVCQSIYIELDPVCHTVCCLNRDISWDVFSFKFFHFGKSIFIEIHDRSPRFFDNRDGYGFLWFFSSNRGSRETSSLLGDESHFRDVFDLNNPRFTGFWYDNLFYFPDI
ncbi:MAG: hypothetical protein ACD_78C00217G0001, partial [uncultured bacterium (gcode 4)]